MATVNEAVADAPTLAAFEDECRAFLEARAPRRGARDEQASEPIVLFDERTVEDELAMLEGVRAWQRTIFDGGFAWITGPTEFGGRELTVAYEQVWERLESDYDVPDQSELMMGVELVSTTIARHGTDGARDVYVRGLRRGDLVGCLLLSEPEAGSDLAAVRTSATPDGDTWVVNGQKVWTSAAHLADVGLLLCRTGPPEDRHRGLTAFAVDMRSPGVEVRPLRQMTGGASFNEVFLADVRVPDAHRLGEVGSGWSVVMGALALERGAIGSGPVGVRQEFTDAILLLARAAGPCDAVLRQELARLVILDRVAMLLCERAAQGAGNAVPSLAKVLTARNHDVRARLVERLVGPTLLAHEGADDVAGWVRFVLSTPALHIAGGTDEIVLTTIADQVLGLPRAP